MFKTKLKNCSCVLALLVTTACSATKDSPINGIWCVENVRYDNLEDSLEASPNPLLLVFALTDPSAASKPSHLIIDKDKLWLMSEDEVLIKSSYKMLSHSHQAYQIRIDDKTPGEITRHAKGLHLQVDNVHYSLASCPNQ